MEDNFYSLLKGAYIILWKVDELNCIVFWEGRLQHDVIPPPHIGQDIREHFKSQPLLVDAVMNARINPEKKTYVFEVNNFFFEFTFVGNIDKNVICVTTDVTERIQFEKERNALAVSEQTALRSSELKSEFLRNMSHEIRTPISGILGISSLLKDTGLDTQQNEYLDSLIACGANLVVLIDDILDLSKIEANKIVLEIIDFDFINLLSTTYQIFSLIAKEKLITFKFENETGKKVLWIKNDPNRIRQVISNLLNNAFKFTPSGGTIVLALKNQSNKMTIHVDVKDTGIGISHKTQEKLFHAFVQANASTTRKYGGSGLGLSIAKRLIEMMGGTIGVKSVLGEGSTFWIDFPYESGLESNSPNMISNNGKQVVNTESVILLAEDNFLNRKIIVKILHSLGYKNVVDVENGQEAFDELVRNPSKYAVLISDMMMPVVDGYELARKVRNLSTKDRNIPILAMTANAMVGEKELCLELGMNEYLSKPIDKHKLGSILRQFLGSI